MLHAACCIRSALRTSTAVHQLARTHACTHRSRQIEGTSAGCCSRCTQFEPLAPNGAASPRLPPLRLWERREGARERRSKRGGSVEEGAGQRGGAGRPYHAYRHGLARCTRVGTACAPLVSSASTTNSARFLHHPQRHPTDDDHITIWQPVRDAHGETDQIERLCRRRHTRPTVRRGGT